METKQTCLNEKKINYLNIWLSRIIHLRQFPHNACIKTAHEKFIRDANESFFSWWFNFGKATYQNERPDAFLCVFAYEEHTDTSSQVTVLVISNFVCCFIS